MKNLISIMIISVFSFSALADSKGSDNIEAEESKSIVTWVGYVDADGGHTTRHDHYLEFVRKSDGESFDIKDSPELEQVHCDSSKKLLVEIEAEKTPRFLFWGGNLIVKDFKVLEELNTVAHKPYVESKATSRAFDRR